MRNLLIIFSVCIFTQNAQAEDKLTIAVASNFLFPLSQVQSSFEEQYSVKLRIISASTAKIYAQIKNGAPFDIFLSADKMTIDKLVEHGLVKKDRTFLYAKGLLAFWAPGQKLVDKRLVQKKVKRIVIANPKFAPYGSAAIQVMKKLNLLDFYEQKLILAENVGQTFQYIFHQNVEAGFVAYSQLKLKEITQDYWLIPAGDYEPILQYGGLLSLSVNKQGAEDFVKFITSQSTQQQLVDDFGYATF